MQVLVTGATGYIGAHVCKVLHEAGFEVHGLDINVNQNKVYKYCSQLYNYNVLDINKLHIQNYDVVVHLAGLISVQDSVSHPVDYYMTNLFGTIEMLKKFKHSHFIFASTAGAFDPQSPYAYSKIAAEQVIRNMSDNYTIFRFFNVAGSDGENIQFGKSTHLVRIAAECAAGVRDKMSIYGTNYDTDDGTCVRDYIHVVDLANAILYACKNGAVNSEYECIGTGKGYSVQQVINVMKEVTGKDFEVEYKERRPGDPARLFVNGQYVGLDVKHNLNDICQSAYKAEYIRKDRGTK